MLKLNLAKILFLICASCWMAATTLPAQTLSTLYSFCSQTNCTDGENPYSGLTQGTDGNLYGTTEAGGTNANPGGTVFKISTSSGALTTLYSFCALSSCWQNGANPLGGLVLATNGDFYGTTWDGACLGGCGTVFKITPPADSLTLVHTFDVAGGALPTAGLVQATNGALYGTTEVGGNYSNCIFGGFASACGTIFAVTPGGSFTSLYSFCAQSNCPDGQFPSAGLIQGSNGNLYGTTPLGGAYLNCSFDTVPTGCGTVFKLTPGGTLTTLYSFCSQPHCVDGAQPGAYGAGLVQGSDGNFYGTTLGGGACGLGTVFKMTPSGILTTLYSFGCASGSDDYPNAGLIQATDGNFYGTTQGNGYNGTVFRITPRGTLTTLYTFCSQPNCADGFTPFAGVVQATDGSFYGTTEEGGANGTSYGTVFSLSMGLKPFVETNPTSGKAGTKVTILGNNLTGATSVTFNGTPAPSFKVNSTGTAITTTVPTGATTGYVQVTTPGGTLSSNVPFRVRP